MGFEKTALFEKLGDVITYDFVSRICKGYLKEKKIK